MLIVKVALALLAFAVAIALALTPFKRFRRPATLVACAAVGATAAPVLIAMAIASVFTPDFMDNDVTFAVFIAAMLLIPVGAVLGGWNAIRWGRRLLDGA